MILIKREVFGGQWLFSHLMGHFIIRDGASMGPVPRLAFKIFFDDYIKNLSFICYL